MSSSTHYMDGVECSASDLDLAFEDSYPLTPPPRRERSRSPAPRRETPRMTTGCRDCPCGLNLRSQLYVSAQFQKAQRAADAADMRMNLEKYLTNAYGNGRGVVRYDFDHAHIRKLLPPHVQRMIDTDARSAVAYVNAALKRLDSECLKCKVVCKREMHKCHHCLELRPIPNLTPGCDRPVVPRCTCADDCNFSRLPLASPHDWKIRMAKW